jgi:predicted ester cyclase
MTRDDMKKLAERLHRLWNTGDLSAIPDIYAPDFSGHFPTGPSRLGELKGHSGVRDAIKRVREAFPDWTETVEDIIIEGDKVVTRYGSTGTHKGPFFDLPPTGKPVRVNEISIFRVEHGLVAEQWCITHRVE